MRSLRRFSCAVVVMLWAGTGAGPFSAGAGAASFMGRLWAGVGAGPCSVVLHAQQPSSPSQKEPMGEFVPLENLPPQEQMPAAPLVIAAYSFVWIGLFVYLV